MSKGKQLYTIHVPPVSSDFAKSLASRFPPIRVDPGVNMESIMYSAGQRSVVEWVLATASSSVVSGDPAVLRDDRPRSLLDKILGRRK